MTLLLAINLFFVFTLLGVHGVGAVSNNLPSQMELSVPLTDYNVYNSFYKTQDPMINGYSVQTSPISGMVLPRDSVSYDLSTVTLESDNIALGSTGVHLQDRSAYSLTFLNETYDAKTTQGTATVTSMAISDKGTTGTFTVVGGSATTVDNGTQKSNLAFDGNNDGDYLDSGDHAYLDLGGNEWFQLAMSTTFTGTNASDFGQITLSFARSTGTNYNISLTEYYTSGDSGWSGIGGTADNQANFKCYDASGKFVAISIPLGQLFTEDSSETGGILGLDAIYVKAGAGGTDTAAMTIKNIAVFNDIPALTDRTDNNNNFDYNDAGHVYAGVNEADTTYFITQITEGATETYDSLIALPNDLSGSITTLTHIRHLSFTGVMSIQPSTSSATSTPYSSYYLTTENAGWDFSAIKGFSSFSNLFTIGNVQLNVTIDDSVYEFTSHYQDNLVVDANGSYDNSFYINNIAQGDTFETAWAASGVSGSSSPKTEIQFDVSDFSGTSYEPLTAQLLTYTKTSGTVTQVTTPTNNNGSSGSGSTDNSMFMIYLIIILLVSITVVVVLKMKDKK